MKVYDFLQILHVCLDGDFNVQVVDKSSGRILDDLYSDRGLVNTPPVIRELEIIGGDVYSEGILRLFVDAPDGIEQVPQEYETTAYVVKKLQAFYERLMERDKPESYLIGGTYYGSTELRSSVGNHLEFISGQPYTSYYYGGRTYYEEVVAVQVGGAYGVSAELHQLERELKPLIDEIRDLEETQGNTCLIADYGTNFSVVGMGRRRAYHGWEASGN